MRMPMVRKLLPLASALLLAVVLPPALAVDQPPKANAGADRAINVGETVWLNGTGQDADGYIVKYEWDFDGDGTFDWESVQGGDAVHTYNRAGVFNATLRVTSDNNVQAIDFARITVKAVNRPPLADAGPDRTGEAGDVLTFNGTAMDPERSIATYQWDFDGDGTWDYSGPEGMASFTYKVVGDYLAYLKVTDAAMPPMNDTDFCAVTIYPRNQKPVANAGDDLTGKAGENLTFVGKASDPEDSISLYEWDFNGDGTWDWKSPASGVAVWRYPDPGTYTSYLRVTDGAPIAATDVSTMTVLILPRNNPPVISGPSSVHALKGRAVTLTVMALDPDPKDYVRSYAWDFDDNGAPDRFTSVGTINWTFNDSGAHVVKVTAYDGLQASAWCRINVTASGGQVSGGGMMSVLPYVLLVLLGMGAGVAAAFPATVWYVKRHWEKFFSPSENEKMRMAAQLQDEQDAVDPFRGGPGNT